MPKVKIKTKIINQSNIIKTNVVGIKNANKISYIDNKTNVIIIINGDKVIMKRINEEMEIEFSFVNNMKTTCKIILKGIKNKISLELRTKELDIKDNKLIITYDLYYDSSYFESFFFELCYEVI